MGETIMIKRRHAKLTRVIVAAAVLSLGIGSGAAQQKEPPGKTKTRLTHADRKASAERAKAKGFALPEIGAVQMAVPGSAPHYFSHPNYANSPLPATTGVMSGGIGYVGRAHFGHRQRY
jgi:hypothetical protein